MHPFVPRFEIAVALLLSLSLSAPALAQEPQERSLDAAPDYGAASDPDLSLDFGGDAIDPSQDVTTTTPRQAASAVAAPSTASSDGQNRTKASTSPRKPKSKPRHKAKKQAQTSAVKTAPTIDPPAAELAPAVKKETVTPSDSGQKVASKTPEQEKPALAATTEASAAAVVPTEVPAVAEVSTAPGSHGFAWTLVGITALLATVGGLLWKRRKAQSYEFDSDDMAKSSAPSKFASSIHHFASSDTRRQVVTKPRRPGISRVARAEVSAAESFF